MWFLLRTQRIPLIYKKKLINTSNADAVYLFFCKRDVQHDNFATFPVIVAVSAYKDIVVRRTQYHDTVPEQIENGDTTTNILERKK